MIAVAELTPRQRASRAQWADPRARALLLARQLIAQEKRRVDRLVRDHLHLIRPAGSHASRITGLPREDCEQAAFLGLVRAMETYDPTKGASPGTHAFWGMRAATRAEYLAMRSTIRVPKQPKSPIPRVGSLDHESDDGSTIGAEIPDDDAPDPAAGLHRAELHDALTAALGSLSERDRLVVEMRFGLDGAERPHQFTEIGDRLGLGGTRARQLFDLALAQLREALTSFAE